VSRKIEVMEPATAKLSPRSARIEGRTGGTPKMTERRLKAVSQTRASVTVERRNQVMLGLPLKRNGILPT